MEELEAITAKYDTGYIQESLKSLEALNGFAGAFYLDAAEIFDVLTRLRNVDRNPTGFDLDDAPILGLLIKVWKLLKEAIRYYEADKAQIISVLERPMIEASVLASYLMTQPSAVIEDYRKCSYKDRLRLLRELKAGSPFFDTKAGKRLLAAVQEKMRFENLTEDDFAHQKANRWRLQGRSFRDIFAEVAHDDLYPATYGMMSEALHGSWNESMDWDLTRNADGTFLPFSLYAPADIRYLTPVLRFAIEPYRQWLQRIDCLDDNTGGALDWIERVNNRLFQLFDQRFGE